MKLYKTHYLILISHLYMKKYKKYSIIEKYKQYERK